MAYEICQLGVNDFEEAIDFINMVFSMHDQPTDFINLLPVYYQPTEKHMKCHHVVKIDGKIRALVGMYPGDLVAGNATLKVARIGAVSTHPYYREHGLMRKLLSHCVDLIKQGDYDIGYLGGLRHRYLYFGYEKCGHKIKYYINKSNIKHSGIAFEDIEIRPALSENKSFIEYCKALHDRQEMHFYRSLEDFYNVCLNWKNNLNGIYKQGILIGYLICSSKGDHISEIHTEKVEVTIETLAAFVSSSSYNEVSLSVSPTELDLNYKLGEFCEFTEIQDTGNWCVYNWEHVVASLMNMKNSKNPLQDGRLVLGIKGYDNLCITVNNGVVDCKKTQEPAALDVESSAAARLLFGPLPPSFVTNLPKDALILNNWCPMPLYMSSQDFA